MGQQYISKPLVFLITWNDFLILQVLCSVVHSILSFIYSFFILHTTTDWSGWILSNIYESNVRHFGWVLLGTAFALKKNNNSIIHLPHLAAHNHLLLENWEQFCPMQARRQGNCPEDHFSLPISNEFTPQFLIHSSKWLLVDNEYPLQKMEDLSNGFLVSNSWASAGLKIAWPSLVFIV